MVQERQMQIYGHKQRKVKQVRKVKKKKYKKLELLQTKNKYKFGLSQTIPEKDIKILMVKIGGGNSTKCMMQC